jgi:hypothetical protein
MLEGILDHGSHTFLVRFWIEPREIAGAPVRMPAHVEYLRTGESRDVLGVAEMIRFIDECLDEAGVPPREEHT